MINAQLEIIIIASLTAIACAIPGTFLVLRRMTMLSDAISHSILLGIVLGFFIVKQTHSPLLIITAALMGLFTVYLVETILKTQLLKEDAAIGVVYPMLFSIAILLISLFASKVHIDTDSVLLGELAFAPLNRLHIGGSDLGPTALYTLGGIALLNISLTIIFFKEIKLVLFDENYAKSIGYNPKKAQYMLMTMVCFTIVLAFDVAGAILVVGFIVGPALIASIYFKRLWSILLFASIIGVIASLLGYFTAHKFNVSIAGSIVTVIGIMFFMTLMFAPGYGIVSKALKRREQKLIFAVDLLLVHVYHHQLDGDSDTENSVSTISEHFDWDMPKTMETVNNAVKTKYLTSENDLLTLTEEGLARVNFVMNR